MKRGTHTSRGGNPPIFLTKLCPFFDLEFSKCSYSRALAPACGALVFLISQWKHMLWPLFRTVSSNRLDETVLMMGHKICFCREISLIIAKLSLLLLLIGTTERLQKSQAKLKMAAFLADTWHHNEVILMSVRHHFKAMCPLGCFASKCTHSPFIYKCLS